MVSNIENKNVKRSYLKGDFEFFHLKDHKHMEFDFHYHDFNKIVITLSGNVTYYIEGKAYRLHPWDILLINNSEVHKVVVEPSEMYERIIIWVNSHFLEKHSTKDCRLQTCFDIALKENLNLLRLDPSQLKPLQSLLQQLEQACKSSSFGSKILKNSIFMQFIVILNRICLGLVINPETIDINQDPTINKVIKYIHDNLSDDLSIENLSTKFFMSRYNFMRRFKASTGYTVHDYILQKRLLKVSTFIKQGEPIVEASEKCGFRDYSSFVRAFKKLFGLSPRQYYKNIMQLTMPNKYDKHFEYDKHFNE